jgi:hypothetical protein
MGAWRQYDGKEHSLKLDIDQGAVSSSATQTVNYPAELEIRDPYDQLVYGAKGTLQCSG